MNIIELNRRLEAFDPNTEIVFWSEDTPMYIDYIEIGPSHTLSIIINMEYGDHA